VVQARAAGITFGRNIWQSEKISGMIRALKLVVHSNSSVKEALDNLAIE
jgi:class I fructose-bisphosphate aldolase/fructose-bisphosphate aldolase/2-amino-3,7-dideoxy-D-threo-hept-6-ulosonate synthase